MFPRIDLQSLIFGEPKHHYIPNVRDTRDGEELFDEALVLGTLGIGRQGVGKSVSVANHRVEYDLRHEHDTTFSLDISGSYTDNYLAIAASKSEDEWKSLKRRIKYIRLADDRLAFPLPEFSLDYGISFDDQSERVVNNLVRLEQELVEGATILGKGAIEGILPNLFSAMTAMEHVEDLREPLQMTEVFKLLSDRKFLNSTLQKCKEIIDGDVYDFFYKRFLGVKQHESELRSYSLSPILSIFRSDIAKGHFGWYQPVWTPKRAIEEGQIVLIDGRKLNTKPMLQHYIFTQIHSLIMEQVKRRDPDNPDDNHVAYIIDEVRPILKNPGLAYELGEISPYYRSRKVQLYLMIQSLSQLDKQLQTDVFHIGNVICFGLSIKRDAEVMAKQLFDYDPTAEKLPPVTDTQNQVSEPVQGQDRQNADWITKLDHRECIVKRHFAQHRVDPHIWFVEKTKDAKITVDRRQLEQLKNEFAEDLGRPVKQILQAIKHRKDALKTKRPGA